MTDLPASALPVRSLKWRLTLLIPIVIVLIHVGMSGWAASRHSPTADEPAYLASGISHWEYGRFDLCQVSPPLVRLVAAVPVMWAQPTLDWKHYHVVPGSRQEHSVGYDFLVANGPRSFWLFTLGRWGCLPFTVLGAWIAYQWGRELFGQWSAYFALLLWCFCPNILAHTQLLTPDAGVTALCLACVYTFWKWSQSQSWMITLLAGSLLGLAVLAKTNSVALFPAIITAIVLQAGFTPRLRTGRSVLQVCVAFAVAVYVVNLGYGFEGSFKPLGKYEFFSRSLMDDQGVNRFRGTPLAALPVPLPSAFLEGIDLQRRDFENSQGLTKTYYRGTWYDSGWWWYYLYVVLVKVPAGTWILFLLGGWNLSFGRAPHRWDAMCYLVVPAVALFALPCSQSGFGGSLRYVLPAIPFGFMIASAAVHTAASRCHRLVAVAALSWMIGSSLAWHPHGLAYFNEISGGAEQGHFHLLDGNVDWGQDVLYVRDWIEQHPQARPVSVACWGRLPLADLGIEFETPNVRPGEPIPPGWYLISVNHLHVEFRMGRQELARFLQLQPVGRINSTMFIYHIP